MITYDVFFTPHTFARSNHFFSYEWKVCSEVDSGLAQKLSYKLQYEKASVDLFSDLSPEDIGIVRNAIYAAHGYDFTDTDYEKVFSEMPWYENQRRSGSEVWRILSDEAKQNIQMMKDIEYRLYGEREENEMQEFAYMYQNEPIPMDILKNKTKRKLRAYRNTLFAWHGVDYSDTGLSVYFQNMNWYINKGKNTSDTYDYEMTQTAQDNIQLIRLIENRGAITERASVADDNMIQQLPIELGITRRTYNGE